MKKKEKMKKRPRWCAIFCMLYQYTIPWSLKLDSMYIRGIIISYNSKLYYGRRVQTLGKEDRNLHDCGESGGLDMNVI